MAGSLLRCVTSGPDLGQFVSARGVRFERIGFRALVPCADFYLKIEIFLATNSTSAESEWLSAGRLLVLTWQSQVLAVERGIS